MLVLSLFVVVVVVVYNGAFSLSHRLIVYFHSHMISRMNPKCHHSLTSNQKLQNK